MAPGVGAGHQQLGYPPRPRSPPPTPEWQRPGHHRRHLGGTPRGRGPTPRVSAPCRRAARCLARRPGTRAANGRPDAGEIFLPRRFLGGYPRYGLPEPTAATARSVPTTAEGCQAPGRANWQQGEVPRRGASRRGKPPQRRRRGPKPRISQTTMSPSRTRKRSSDVWKRGDLCTSAPKSDPAKDSWGREHLHAARPPRLPCQVYEGRGKRGV